MTDIQKVYDIIDSIGKCGITQIQNRLPLLSRSRIASICTDLEVKDVIYRVCSRKSVVTKRINTVYNVSPEHKTKVNKAKVVKIRPFSSPERTVSTQLTRIRERKIDLLKRLMKRCVDTDRDLLFGIIKDLK